MDPVTVISGIAAALGLVDKFAALIGRLRTGAQPTPRVETRRDGDAIVISSDGKVLERVTAAQLHLSSFDEVRFDALSRRVDSLWKQFNLMYAKLPDLAADEQIRIQQRMDDLRLQLCGDFREMVEISEQALGVPLGDHYSLGRICGS